ncbi:hypothetical protein PR048_006256 [Dryococelus australis]|uniref:Peptidase M14 domain-containing protein n=1 Tax=Dryococelus australis TaxID=614101 RepID=A0ABQ9IAJ2_9NEOP|nr:hypothetical protein PR048_006256 [Dryococelus australis]
MQERCGLQACRCSVFRGESKPASGPSYATRSCPRSGAAIRARHGGCGGERVYSGTRGPACACPTMATTLATLLLALAATAAAQDEESGRSYRGYRLYRVFPADGAQLAELRGLVSELGADGEQLSFWSQYVGRNGSSADLLAAPGVGAEVTARLDVRRIPYLLLIPDLEKAIQEENPPMDPEEEEFENRGGHRLTWTRYHRYKGTATDAILFTCNFVSMPVSSQLNIDSYLDYLANIYTDICKTEVIGKSSQGRDMKILKVSTGGKGKPAIWIDGDFFGPTLGDTFMPQECTTSVVSHIVNSQIITGILVLRCTNNLHQQHMGKIHTRETFKLWLVCEAYMDSSDDMSSGLEHQGSPPSTNIKYRYAEISDMDHFPVHHTLKDKAQIKLKYHILLSTSQVDLDWGTLDSTRYHASLCVIVPLPVYHAHEMSFLFKALRSSPASQDMHSHFPSLYLGAYLRHLNDESLFPIGIHGREWISPATVTYILLQLVEFREQHSELLDSVDWYILPVANPDGYEYSHTKDRLWRKTRSSGIQTRRKNGKMKTCYGVDPNRNWDFHWREGVVREACQEDFAGLRAFSEPETRAMSDYIMANRNNIKVYLTLHSYSQMWLVPWGYKDEKPRDYYDMYVLAEKGVKALEAVRGIDYLLGTAAELMYTSAGGSDDWVKGAAGVKYSYSVELPDTGKYGFVLPASQIEPVGQETWAAIKAIATHFAEGHN